jgi:hypothetical protein
MKYNIVETLMRRDSISREEAQEMLEAARNDVEDGLDPEEALKDLGLEPDYVFDLLEGLL